MTVKVLLKQIREKRGLSQNKLAQIMTMSLQNIQRIEYGDAKSIPLETLDRLCEALDCQPGDLLIKVDDPDRENALIEQMLLRLNSDSVEKISLKSEKSSQTSQLNSLLAVNLMSNSA
ncbi:MAG: helix-turn-helix domain-containing protein [Pleurocapsa minor HA4230-MV1]|jgi:putative transcriptional regulator|nr:helix-turn-helix domain-containing protein [Pleurocapsa minor HA4230-MV1]